MERKELDNLSKDELMERIRTKCNAEMRPLKIMVCFVLVILIYELVDYWWVKSTELSYCALPAIVVLWSAIEVWWKNRMSKCDDAKQMVSLHENYIKYQKAEYFIALVVGVFLAYLFYKDYHASVAPLWLTVFIVGLGVALFCWIVWHLIKLPKELSNPEIDRLRELKEKI